MSGVPERVELIIDSCTIGDRVVPTRERGSNAAFYAEYSCVANDVRLRHSAKLDAELSMVVFEDFVLTEHA